MARGVPIISVDIGSVPYGFLGRYQALPGRNRDAAEIAVEIFRLLEARPAPADPDRVATLRMAEQAARVAGHVMSDWRAWHNEELPASELGRRYLDQYRPAVIWHVNAFRDRGYVDHDLTGLVLEPRFPEEVREIATRLRGLADEARADSNPRLYFPPRVEPSAEQVAQDLYIPVASVGREERELWHRIQEEGSRP